MEPPADATRPLRILHMTYASDAGGLSRYIYNLCAAAHAAGHSVAVAGARGAWHERFLRAPWPWIEVPLNGGPLSLRRAAATLRDYLRDHPVDLLHTHYRRSTLVARLLQKSIGLPILYTVHQPGISLRWGQRWLSDFGDFTHAPSEEARRWLIEVARLKPDRIAVIPHGVHTESFPPAGERERAAARQSLGLSPDDLVAAFVGRLDVPKNEGWIIDVAEAAARPLPTSKFLVAGDGPHMARMQRRVRRLRLQERVRLLGECDPLPVYQAADVLLVPSQREGFSLVTAESMSVGTPVFRTRTGGSSALIVEGITGKTAPIDQRQFVEQAVEFMSNPVALRAMRPAAARHIRDHFTFDRQFAQTLALYRQLSRT